MTAQSCGIKHEPLATGDQSVTTGVFHGQRITSEKPRKTRASEVKIECPRGT